MEAKKEEGQTNKQRAEERQTKSEREREREHCKTEIMGLKVGEVP